MIDSGTRQHFRYRFSHVHVRSLSGVHEQASCGEAGRTVQDKLRVKMPLRTEVVNGGSTRLQLDSEIDAKNKAKLLPKSVSGEHQATDTKGLSRCLTLLVLAQAGRLEDLPMKLWIKKGTSASN